MQWLLQAERNTVPQLFDKIYCTRLKKKYVAFLLFFYISCDEFERWSQLGGTLNLYSVQWPVTFWYFYFKINFCNAAKWKQNILWNYKLSLILIWSAGFYGNLVLRKR